jgi:hypothetical protein
VQTFHEPPSLRPRCSSLSAVGHPRAGTKLHREGNPRLGKVYRKNTRKRRRILSQEPLMPTAHRLSFPTCLSHPRSIHLHCHLDSPSAANLPCLGLQQQTRPKISELCGSYRAPSRSSLLPLRTLSPGEVTHRLRNLSLQPQPPLSPGESVVYTRQQLVSSTRFSPQSGNHEFQHDHTLVNKPHAVKHCIPQQSTGNIDTTTQS